MGLRACHIELSAMATPWEMGAVEIGQFWEWQDVAIPRSLGIDSRSVVTPTSRGASHVMKQWAPRLVSGSRDVVDQAELDTKLLDFQADMGFSRPFVWCEDIDDSSTWARQCMLVRNRTLPPGEVNELDAGRLQYDFVEHLR